MLLSTEEEIENMKWSSNVSFKCDGCGELYEKTKRRHLASKKKRSNKLDTEKTTRTFHTYNKNFCTDQCKNSYNRSLTVKEFNCKVCDKVFTGYIKQNPQFCGHSCSAKNSNKVSPKRHADDILCKGKCGKNLGKYWINKREYCEECLVILNNRKSIVKKNLGDRTFEEYLSNYKFRDRANRYTAIRQNAKKTMERSGIKKCCKNCGYDKHAEVCHIKGISTFQKTCFISEINSLDNLVYLCPNCHWEYDHKMLNL